VYRRRHADNQARRAPSDAVETARSPEGSANPQQNAKADHHQVHRDVGFEDRPHVDARDHQRRTDEGRRGAQAAGATEVGDPDDHDPERQ